MPTKKNPRLPNRRPVSTPTRSRPPSSPPNVVGSSCIWGKDILDELKVIYKIPEVDATTMFDQPEKWFDFKDLDHYEKGILSDGI
jgi:hypothetical protein